MKGYGAAGVLGALIVIVLAGLGLAACGGGSESTNSQEPNTVTSTSTPPGAEDLAGVCEGNAQPSAPDYDKTAGAIVVYEDDGDGYEFRDYTDTLPEGTLAVDPTEASLVVCLEVKSSEVVDTCTFDDPDTGETFRSQLANATYSVKLYEAKSGDELERERGLRAVARECPESTGFPQGDSSKTAYARPLDDLQGFIESLTDAGL